MRNWFGVLTVAIGIATLAITSAPANQAQTRPPVPRVPATKPPLAKPPVAKPPVAPAPAIRPPVGPVPATKPPVVKPPAVEPPVKGPAPQTPGPQPSDPDDAPGNEDKGNEEETVKVKLTDCPAAVQKTLQRESGGGTLDEIDKQNDGGQALYEAGVKLDGKNYDVLVAADGTLLKKELDEDEGKESAVKFDECPPAVQKTLVREAAGAKIEMVAKQSRQGRPIYEATVPIDGKPYDIVVDGDGLLLVKRLDDDEQEMPEASAEKT